MTFRYALKVAYLGVNYKGFQRQGKTIPTIEGRIIETLERLGILSKKRKARYSAAGRTDTGVSALSQVIAFDTKKEEIHLEKINQELPDDIFAWGIARVNEEFNARRHAYLRTYKYFKPYDNEDINLIKLGLIKMIGTHDFKKFSKKSDLLPSGITKRTILTLEKGEVNLLSENNILEFTFSSQSFLWHQVRKMVALLIVVGNKEQPIEMINEALNPKSKEPRGGIRLAPAEGLVLFDVVYHGIEFQSHFNKQNLEKKLMGKVNSYLSLYAILKTLQKTII